LESDRIDDHIMNVISFKQGDGLVTIKTPFTHKAADFWVLTHYRWDNIEKVDFKSR